MADDDEPITKGDLRRAVARVLDYIHAYRDLNAADTDEEAEEASKGYLAAARVLEEHYQVGEFMNS